MVLIFRKWSGLRKTSLRGKIITYKELAIKIFRVKAHRVVANTCTRDQLEVIPCHEVIRSEGKIVRNMGKK